MSLELGDKSRAPVEKEQRQVGKSNKHATSEPHSANNQASASQQHSDSNKQQRRRLEQPATGAKKHQDPNSNASQTNHKSQVQKQSSRPGSSKQTNEHLLAAKASAHVLANGNQGRQASSRHARSDSAKARHIQQHQQAPEMGVANGLDASASSDGLSQQQHPAPLSPGAPPANHQTDGAPPPDTTSAPAAEVAAEVAAGAKSNQNGRPEQHESGLPGAGEPDDDELDEMEPDDEDEDEEEATNGGRKMFVGGLSWQTGPDGLRDYFGRYGEITEVMIMNDSATRRSR